MTNVTNTDITTADNANPTVDAALPTDESTTTAPESEPKPKPSDDTSTTDVEEAQAILSSQSDAATTATTDIANDAPVATDVANDVADAQTATDMDTETVGTDTNQLMNPDTPADTQTFFEKNFANSADFGDLSKYFHVNFSALQQDGGRVFGSIPVYAARMFSLDSIRQDIMQNGGYIDVAIASWQEIETLEEFNAMFGDTPVESTGNGISYYHVHYILIDGQGGQVFGTTPAQTDGILNFPSLKSYIAGLYNTIPDAVVITNWIKLDTVEDFAALNSYVINEPTPQQ